MIPLGLKGLDLAVGVPHQSTALSSVGKFWQGGTVWFIH